MKGLLSFISVIVFFVTIGGSSLAQDKSSSKYVGVKTCSPCHRTDKQGMQFDIWKKSKHSEAYQVLLTEAATEVAKKNGLTAPAAESPECLSCHTITETKMVEKSFDVKDGVQCESCHGAGSAYKSITIMKDPVKAVAAGMREFKDDAAIEKFCITCHNEKSPTYKGFNFKEMWGKIKHPVPKK
jgi:hypothetical protein